MPTEQEKLIGKHPNNSHFIGSWLISEDITVTPEKPNKKHRKLSELPGQRQNAINEIAKWIVSHHVDAKKIQRLQNRKAEIIAKYGIPIDQYVDKLNLFPKLDTVQTGNATEIILTQYLQTTSGLSLLAYKLTYNPNVDQAMKGDDCLLFRIDDLSSGIITGEAKYRGIPSKKVVEDMVENLEGSKKLPISLPFISQHFSSNGDEDMAAKIEDLQYDVSKGLIPIINVGMLLSTKGESKSTDAAMRIEADLNSTNPNLVMLSLGTDNPKEILEEAFKRAKTYLMAQI